MSDNVGCQSTDFQLELSVSRIDAVYMLQVVFISANSVQLDCLASKPSGTTSGKWLHAGFRCMY